MTAQQLKEMAVDAQGVEIADICLAFGVADFGPEGGVSDAEPRHEVVEAQAEVLAIFFFGDADSGKPEGLAVGEIVGAEGIYEGSVEVGNEQSDHFKYLLK